MEVEKDKVAELPAVDDALPPPRPDTLEPIFDGVHPELRAVNDWCFWDHTWRGERNQYAKVPYRLNGSRCEASANDPNTFGKFQDAKRLFRIWGRRKGETSVARYSGIGFRLGNGFVGVDLDDSVAPDGSPEPWAKKVIDELPGAYWELSPSGTGYKAICRGSIDLGGKTGRKRYHLDGESLGGGDRAIEFYDRDRYFTITGHRYLAAETPEKLPDLSPKLQALLLRTLKPSVSEADNEPTARTHSAAGDSQQVFELRSIDDILQRCRRASNWPKIERLLNGDTSGYPSHSEADVALVSLFAFYTQDEQQLEQLITQSGLNRPKWEERPDYRAETIKAALEITKETYDWKLATKQRKKKESATPRSKPDKAKPDVEIGTDEHRVNDQVIAALAKLNKIFDRGGNLVEVIESGDASRGVESSAATQRIAKLGPARIREIISEAVDFITIVNRGTPDEYEAPAHVPVWCAKAIEERGTWPGIPVIRGVVDTPVLRPDGTIADQPGFDHATGLLLALRRKWPKVADYPTSAEAKTALASLYAVVQDFPLNEDHQRPAWLSLVLTPFARHAFNGPAPAGTIDANGQGVGKGLLADTIGLIATGENLDRMSSPSTDDEMRKRITSIAISAQRFVLIDNHVGLFGCPSLDAALTSTTWSDRLLGGNSTFSGPIDTMWLVTANNITMTPDAMRRTIYIRMDSKDERPEDRTGFAFQDLRAEVRRRRPELVHAALTILRYFVVNGRPNITGNSLGSFEGWSDLVRQAVANVTGIDPLEARKSLRQTVDSETSALGNLLECWEAAYPDGCLTADALRHVAPHDVLGADTRTEAERALCDAILNYCPGRDGKLPTPRALGTKLKSIRRRNVNDRAFESHEQRVGFEWKVYHPSQSI